MFGYGPKKDAMSLADARIVRRPKSMSGTPFWRSIPISQFIAKIGVALALHPPGEGVDSEITTHTRGQRPSVHAQRTGSPRLSQRWAKY